MKGYKGAENDGFKVFPLWRLSALFFPSIPFRLSLSFGFYPMRRESLAGRPDCSN